ncbi:MAG TPA: hypothetical protein VJ673_24055 [Aromatoleum sp.]|uniref:hypothetical protein n=1 Tax=Aromatoleum sp. TaxID=2307007 RepID=UPI002B499604|nr:hypothetical protein [Aromatoleum sp.]HJV28772.1 hypothetical protein [Aromatoleum sp.]
MLDLLGAAALVVAFLFVLYFANRQRMQEGLAWLETQPENVARLYLRVTSEVDAYWLHVQMKDGKKRLIAAPWELEETLRRLEPLGLRLAENDRALVEAALRDRAPA